MNIIEDLNWRYATKKFDDSKKISNDDIDTLLETVRLSASSYGLQPYQVLVITNDELREKLKSASWGQSQITDASHLIIFANKADFGNELVDDYLENVAETRNLKLDSLNQYGEFMKSKLGMLSEVDKKNWTAKQTYIALGNLLSAAATLKIDSCPMEGFDAKEYNKILDLDKKNLNASVVITLGYRSEEDETQHYKKVRKSNEELFIQL
ncbi:NAD(P)H-dependent oxidoreductase [Aurantibacter crassamenti]|uniref:NAD(P)H-dependent oxidoreductase n=1 Tax=Aurantibacter crassamenti TaxID=1837375 RepID=UPI00193A0F1F|nr:NAD(P)H-dependent oxidoreductase [Aurantibacter crassamenti]MBM1107989.1 NAD(P)H-dependent oxidoreductase [Aurantibacter crassamenti]